MPLSGLIGEWDGCLIQSERRALSMELESRGHRMSSLPVPADDVPDARYSELKLSMGRQPIGGEPLRRRQAHAGAVACYVVVVTLILAPAFHLGSLMGAILYLALGIAIHRGSRAAARAAVIVACLVVLGLAPLFIAALMGGRGS